MQKIISAVLLGASITLAGWVGPAEAWWSHGNNTHAELLFLSSDVMGPMGRAETQAMRQGAADPDEGRLFKDHSATKRRSIDSYCAAVRTLFRAALRNDQSQFPMVGRRMARSMHYLQDRGDPTKGFSSGRTRHLRGVAHQLLVQGGFKRGSVWRRSVAYHRGQVQRANLDFIYTHIARVREQLHNQIARAYQLGGPERDQRIYGFLVESFAVIKACQDRMFTLFQLELDHYRHKRGRCYP